MSGAVRLSIADIAHRTLVSGLFGLSVYGLYGMYAIHTETMKAGEEALAKHNAEQARLAAGGSALTDGFVDPPPTRPS